MSCSKTSHNEEACDLLGDMAWELEYLVKQFDPSGKNREWDDARRLVEKYKTLEKKENEA